MLPRPVVRCRPDNFGYHVLNNMYWMNHLAKLLEEKHLIIVIHSEMKRMISY